MVVIRPGAKQDIRDGIDWYREHGGRDLGRRFFQAVSNAFKQIEAHPHTWSRWQEDARFQRVLVKQFPFIVFYRLMPNQIRIVAAAHARRVPGYWKER